MSSQRLQRRKIFKLNEILDALEADGNDVPFPKSVSILPPENANADVTDEDSGDEDIVNIQNLPGSQLRAEAEVAYHQSSSKDEDYNIPLPRLAKRSRTEESPTQNLNLADSFSSSPIPSTSTSDDVIVPTVSKNQNYKWCNRHNPKSFSDWKEFQAPKNQQPPIYYFDCMFGDNAIQLLVHYTNLSSSSYQPVNIHRWT